MSLIIWVELHRCSLLSCEGHKYIPWTPILKRRGYPIPSSLGFVLWSCNYAIFVLGSNTLKIYRRACVTNCIKIGRNTLKFPGHQFWNFLKSWISTNINLMKTFFQVSKRTTREFQHIFHVDSSILSRQDEPVPYDLLYFCCDYSRIGLATACTI